MEYQLKKELVPVCETIFEGTSEQPIDLDFSLPDYCPDIERILKCRVCPSVTAKSITGDRMDVDGSAVIRLYYLDSRKQAIRLCEHTVPFSCSFNLKAAPTDPVSSVRLRTEYLNCRALSPRRLDIHGAFSVCVSVYDKGEQEICSRIEGDDIQQKLHQEQISRLCGTGQQQFSVSEVLDIGQGKGTPESILRSELTVHTESAKALNDKIMLKGEAVLHLLYITDIESGSQDTMTFHVPFSQILDVQGVNENTGNEIMVDVMNYDVSLKSEFDESSTLVSLDARLCACVFAYETIGADVVDDAYSTAYELELTYKQNRYNALTCLLNTDITAKGEVNTGDSGITRVIDIWSDTVNSMTVYENDVLTVKGKVNCCILALDRDGVPFYAERPIDFSVNPSVPSGLSEVIVHSRPAVKSLSFIITGDNTLEVKADLTLSGAVFDTRTCRSVVSAEGREDQRREKDSHAALTLYYADEGESLWSIARLYCTSVEAIRLENDMTDDVMSARGMILIPM